MTKKQWAALLGGFVGGCMLTRWAIYLLYFE